MNRYAKAAEQLRIIHRELTAALARCEAHIHRDMKQVAPGIWIHNDYQNLTECIADLKKMLP